MISKKIDVLLAYTGTALLLLTPFYYLVNLLTWFIDTSSPIRLVFASVLDLSFITLSIRFYYKN
ncbi:hypothetical protein ab3b_02073 [Weissella cibaria]|uniref:Uncharacterized protein n=1 Tax=Weissella cibaria TaxID=137591 RepID=A0A0D1K7Q1_9LACO|nr:hypothetical protein ab3b_02073 [Weissella cibaria]